MQLLVNSFSKPFIVFHTNYLICFSFNNKNYLRKPQDFKRNETSSISYSYKHTHVPVWQQHAPFSFHCVYIWEFLAQDFFLSRTSVISERMLMNKITQAEPIPNSVTINYDSWKKKIKVFSRPWKNSMTLKKKFLAQFKFLVVQSICVCALNDYNHFPES